MSNSRLVIITGLPGTGKTTLARELAIRERLPLISKDTIKEPLMDVLAANARSRELSNAAFAVMFALARELLELDESLILEGNFRRGEHETPLLAVLAARQVTVVQVLCRRNEAERRAVLVRRQTDPARHAGHRDAFQLDYVPQCDEFLELPGDRRLYHVGSPSCEIFS